MSNTSSPFDHFSYGKAKLSHNFRMELSSLDHYARFVSHIDVFALNEIISNDLVQSPFD